MTVCCISYSIFLAICSAKWQTLLTLTAKPSLIFLIRHHKVVSLILDISMQDCLKACYAELLVPLKFTNKHLECRSAINKTQGYAVEIHIPQSWCGSSSMVSFWRPFLSTVRCPSALLAISLFCQ